MTEAQTPDVTPEEVDTVEPEVVEASVVLSHRRQVGQAEYDANRKERKARAKVTVAENAKKAATAKKKALAKEPARKDADFVKRALEIEKRQAEARAAREAEASK
ncbi:hypothetical protein SEA_ALAKAZAM_10 [Microbacterium phage Alakazam]|nr:hypothetical protein SEA_ALAKAZAM_10 [Microbacterium phage Alakazam]